MYSIISQHRDSLLFVTKRNFKKRFPITALLYDKAKKYVMSMTTVAILNVLWPFLLVLYSIHIKIFLEYYSVVISMRKTI